jgi:hypothetical protein
MTNLILRCFLSFFLLGTAGWSAAAPTPIARWTFDDGTANDVVGSMHGTLNGGATVANGHLVLNGSDAFVLTAPVPANVTARTLVAHVALSTLDQGGGGVMTIQRGDGEEFDSIVYAERQARKWISGSDFWRRTADVTADPETAGPTEFVQVAIVYGADNSIALYRNGVPYGAPYLPGNPVRTYNAGNARVLLGMRHGLTATGGRMLSGEIDEALLFNRALSPAEIGTLAGLSLFVWKQPQNQFAFVGGGASFVVGAEGAAPLGFQWLKDGQPMPGQTATNLSLSNVQFSNAGSYSLVVSNGFGMITSAVATLTVYQPIQNNLVARWKLDDSTGLITTNATPNALTGVLAEFPDDDSQWSFGLIEGALSFSGTRRVAFEDSPLFHLDSFSVAFWIQADALGFDSSVISKESSSICETWGLELRGSGQLNFFLFNQSGFIADVQSSVNLDLGNFHHVVLVYNRATSRPDIYLDGALVSSTRGTGPATGAAGYDGSPLTLGRRLGSCPFGQSFTGLLDDVQLYDRNLNSSEAAFLFHNPGEVLNPNVSLPPAITTQPLGQTVLVGSNATFTVAAAGTTPLRYQWRKGDELLGSQTNTVLTLPAARLADAGEYSVIVSNYLGSVTSSIVRLDVVTFGGGAVARWTFDDGTANDVIGSMHGTLNGGATISAGRLVLNGTDGFVQTAPLGVTVTEKTLAAWVALSTLDQGGGGVITLEQGAPGAQFDSIVYAERQARRWMAGSDFWRRTTDVSGPEETSPPGVLVHLAIIYRNDNSIAVYRNGRPYGAPYTQGVLQTYEAGQGQVLLGRRHTGATLLNGEVDEATLYNRALLPAEIEGLFAPRLGIARSANTLTISWPATIPGFILESSAVLPAASWEEVSGVAGNSVTISLPAGERFYRLRRK